MKSSLCRGLQTWQVTFVRKTKKESPLLCKSKPNGTSTFNSQSSIDWILWRMLQKYLPPHTCRETDAHISWRNRSTSGSLTQATVECVCEMMITNSHLFQAVTALAISQDRLVKTYKSHASYQKGQVVHTNNDDNNTRIRERSGDAPMWTSRFLLQQEISEQ